MKKLLITTTDSLHGWDIEAYLTPVFASVVLGTNIFADGSAAWTDFWGGRSSSYEKRLQLIKDNAIEILSDKASRLGANCILGLKVDMDEISGKGTQMFMITAVGMAVIAKNKNSHADPKQSKEIDKEYVKEQSNVIRLAKKFTSIEVPITEEEVKIIIASKSTEFKEYILGKLKLYSDGEFGKLFKEYFSVIDANDASEILYDKLITETSEGYLKTIVEIIKDNDLLDYDGITKLLNGPTDKKKIGLTLSLAFKPSYSLTDIKAMGDLINALTESFPKISSLTTKKGFLSSTEKEAWACVCKTTNDQDVNYCNGCGQDQYGFRSDELKPQQVIESLSNRLTGLKNLLS